MARRYDPDRRQRIIDAAIRVVGAKGIAGLSHRTVAAEADVPLGSTTYHFKTLDDLMVAALRQANEDFAKTVAARDALRDPGTDLATELAALGGEWSPATGRAWRWSTSSTSPPCAHPPCGPSPTSGDGAFADSLARRTDPVTARALVALIDGICLQVLLTGVPYDEEYAREVLARVIP